MTLLKSIPVVAALIATALIPILTFIGSFVEKRSMRSRLARDVELLKNLPEEGESRSIMLRIIERQLRTINSSLYSSGRYLKVSGVIVIFVGMTILVAIFVLNESSYIELSTRRLFLAISVFITFIGYILYILGIFSAVSARKKKQEEAYADYEAEDRNERVKFSAIRKEALDKLAQTVENSNKPS